MPRTVEEIVLFKVNSLQGKVPCIEQCFNMLHENLESLPMDINSVNMALDNMIVSFEEFAANFECCSSLNDSLHVKKKKSIEVTYTQVPSSEVSIKSTENTDIVSRVNKLEEGLDVVRSTIHGSGDDGTSSNRGIMPRLSVLESSYDEGKKKMTVLEQKVQANEMRPASEVGAIRDESVNEDQQNENEKGNITSEKRLENIEKNLQETHIDNDAYKQRLIIVEDEIKSMKEARIASKDPSKELESTDGEHFPKLETRVQEADSKSDDCENRLTNLEEELKIVKPAKETKDPQQDSENKSMNEKIGKLDKNIDATISASDGCKDRLTNLEEELLKTVKSAIETKDPEQTSENKSENGKIEKLEEKIDATVSESGACKDRLTSLEEELKTMKLAFETNHPQQTSENKSVIEKIEKLEEKFNTTKSDSDAYKDKLTSLEEELNTLKSVKETKDPQQTSENKSVIEKIEKLEEKCDATVSDSNYCKDRLTSLGEELISVKSAMETKGPQQTSENKSMNEKLEKLEEKIDATISGSDNYKDRLTRLEEELLKTLKSAIETKDSKQEPENKSANEKIEKPEEKSGSDDYKERLKILEDKLLEIIKSSIETRDSQQILENKSLNEKIEKLKEKIDATISGSDGCKDKLTNLEEELLKTVKSAIETKDQEQTSEHKSENGKIEKSEEKMNATVSETSTCKDRLTSLEEEFKTLKLAKEIKDPQQASENKSLSEKIEKLEEKMNATLSESGAYKDRLTSLEEELKTSKSAEKSNDPQQNSENKSMTEKIEKLEAKMDATITESGAYKDRLTSLEEELKTLKSAKETEDPLQTPENKSMTEKIEKLEVKIDAKVSESDAYKSRLTSLEEELKTLKSAVETNDPQQTLENKSENGKVEKEEEKFDATVSESGAYKDRLTSLEEEFKILKSAKKSNDPQQTPENKSVTEKIEKLEEKMDTTLSESGRYKDRLTTLEEELKTLKSAKEVDNPQQTSENKSVTEKIEKLEEKFAATVSESGAYKSRLTSLEEELKNMKPVKETEDLQQTPENKSVTEKIEKLEEKFDTTVSESGAYKSRLTSLEEELKTLKSAKEVDNPQQTLENKSVTEKIEKLEEKFDTTVSESGAYKSRLTSLEEELKTLKSAKEVDNPQQTSENKSVTEKIEKLEEKFDTTVSESGAYKSRLTSLEEELKTLKSAKEVDNPQQTLENKSVTEKIEKLEEKFDTTVSESGAYKSRLTSLEEELKTLKSAKEVDNPQQTLENKSVTEKIEKLEEKFDTTVSESGAYKSRLTNLEEELKTLKSAKEVDNPQQTLENKSVTEKIEKLEEKFDTTVSESGAYKSRLTSLEEELKTLKSAKEVDNPQQTSENKSVTEKIEKLEEKFAATVSESDAYKNRLTSLEEKLNSVKSAEETKDPQQTSGNKSVNDKVEKLEEKFKITLSNTDAWNDRLKQVEDQLKSVKPVSDVSRDKEMKGLKLKVTNLDSLTRTQILQKLSDLENRPVVAFQVWLKHVGPWRNGTVIQGVEKLVFNIGNSFQQDLCRFLSPVDGIYCFILHLLVKDANKCKVNLEMEGIAKNESKGIICTVTAEGQVNGGVNCGLCLVPVSHKEAVRARVYSANPFEYCILYGWLVSSSV